MGTYTLRYKNESLRLAVAEFIMSTLQSSSETLHFYRIHIHVNADTFENNQVSAPLMCDQHSNRKPVTVCQYDERLLSSGGVVVRGGG